jgi:tetratricopeptide (TPR) repeat protein
MDPTSSATRHGDSIILDHKGGFALGIRTELDRAIRVAQEAVELTPPGHIDRPSHLNNLGMHLSKRYSQADQPADLDEAIKVTQEAVELTPLGSNNRPRRLNNLGSQLSNRYLLVGRPADINEAIKVTQQAVELTPPGSNDRPRLLNNLGSHLFEKHKRTSQRIHLDEAIKVTQEAVELTPATSQDRLRRLNNLGMKISERYSQAAQAADLDEAIKVAQEVVKLTPATSNDRLHRLDSLGSYLFERYLRAGQQPDLDRAIEVIQEAIKLTLPGSDERLRCLNNLGQPLFEKYKRSGQQTDLDEAIEVAQEAAGLTLPGSDDRHGCLNNLGGPLFERYKRSGQQTDLDEAIKVAQEAIDLTPTGSNDRHGYLSNLGIYLSEKYSRAGQPADLDKAIKVTQEAVELTPSGSSDRPGRLSNLGNRFSERYSRSGQHADLDKAIKFAQEAIDLTPTGSNSRHGYLSNLGSHLSERYSRAGQRADIDEAIKVTQEAVELTPPGSIDRPRRLNNLGNRFSERYSQTGQQTDLDEAIKVAQEAIDLTPTGSNDRPGCLNNLGINLSERYLLAGQQVDLDEAIRVTQEAVELTPTSSNDRPGCLNNLGRHLFERYKRSGQRVDLDKTVRTYSEAASTLTSPVPERLRAFRALLGVHGSQNQWKKALKVGRSALQLIPTLAPRSYQNSDKKHLLALVAGLASDAAAVSLRLQEPAVQAIQLLEQGRGILTGDLMDIRSVPLELEQHHPNLANQFIHLRNQMGLPDSVHGSRIYSEAQGKDRQKASELFDLLLEEVRQQSGFERFLQPPMPDEIQDAASRGPIVYINVSTHGCDALIIDGSGISSIPLTGLNLKTIRSRSKELTSIKPPLLEWLWEAVASPILEQLDIGQCPVDGKLPHIWWIPTGLLSLFPIHAAGYNLEQQPRAVLDVVVSSYSSSVRAVLRSRSISLPEFSKDNRVVLVTMKVTPPSKELPFARAEIEEVQRLCQKAGLATIQPVPIKKDVLHALQSCKVFHFAGHGHSNPSDPLQSYLMLNDYESTQMTLTDFLETNILDQSPFLAYLSACGTGQIQDESMVDEGLHLANSFQLAGFRHVIGTLWEVEDELCLDMARITYEWVLRDKMGDDSVCLGLHEAMKWSRDQWRTGKVETVDSRDCQPETSHEIHSGILNWVPYVHFGA